MATAAPTALPWRTTLAAGVAAFTAYFTMYAVRKPFAAAAYDGAELFGSAVALKTAFVVSQLLGYAASKYLGIRVCSAVPDRARGRVLLGLVLWAEGALVLFAVLPPAGRVVAMFLNGLTLGMVWGLVVRYLEGRRATEVLLAVLSLSYILAGGPVKDVGQFVLAWGVGEYWMPAAVGLLFLPAYAGAVWVLHRLPPPDEADRRLRSARPPLDGAGRWAFLRRFGAGLVPLLLLVFALTAYRDFRDIFGAELFAELGSGDVPGAFTLVELPGAAGVLGALALLACVRDNRLALILLLGVMAVGLVTIGAATWLHGTGRIGGLAWVSLTGLGAYLAYVPFSAVLFDRLIAYTRFTGTAAFAIALADAIGYTGSVCLFLTRDVLFADAARLDFFRGFSYTLAGGGLLLVAAGAVGLLSLRPHPRPEAVRHPVGWGGTFTNATSF